VDASLGAGARVEPAGGAGVYNVYAACFGLAKLEELWLDIILTGRHCY